MNRLLNLLLQSRNKAQSFTRLCHQANQIAILIATLNVYKRFGKTLRKNYVEVDLCEGGNLEDSFKIFHLKFFLISKISVNNIPIIPKVDASKIRLVE